MMQRPTPNENEEDLLQLAAQFTQSLPESRPAAIAIRSKPPSIGSKKDSTNVKKSLFAQKRAETAPSQFNLPPKIQLNDILGDIVEKEAVIGEFKTQQTFNGFPKVFHRSERSFAKPSALEKSSMEPIHPEFQDIHHENMNRLSKMSLEEIKEAQQEIMEKLSPQVIEMLKNKKLNKETKMQGMFIIINR
jgi:hypothetical protein